MSIKVLIVEDDREIRGLLRTALAAEGFEVLTAVSVSEATALLEHDPPDLVVLDLGLPDGDGAQLVRAVRSKSAMPIIVASARHQEAEKISLLDEGADDYLTKPFGVSELLARIRVALRAVPPSGTERPLRSGRAGPLTPAPRLRAVRRRARPA